ncbi:hypothetical protein CesoFtcFv8_009482 [Champsocephalus esox]|uniref:Uncharacterized protein n=1 Tax=Champsocephalus esox TaxID=159716 RepID=A0AAN8CA62_9TELE|nr:hypothetical protein CesoFtcFv8_009482 [Champsocephalus esox]
MQRLTYAGPAHRAEGSRFNPGSKSADELILTEELDAVGDALQGLLSASGARGNRNEDESPGSFLLAKLLFWHLQTLYGHYCPGDQWD